ncbi:MAG: cytochrome c-type biogenesis CcmF C-terminal domain-containing protein, partial [Anaerolineales bacterium]
IPYAFAVAALVTGRTDDRWIRLTRRWTLAAWLFLSLGLVLGMRWAYDVLGWGGYWSWDPVEIAALMPWLVGTAFLHSVMIQEKRGMFKLWNMLLIILTYSLVIFGTFLTRSGVLSSVHAFAQSAIGPMFFIFIGITFFISASLLIYRWSDLRAEVEMKSILSREALFLLNNLLFFGVLIVCFWGIIFPLISEIVTGQQLTVGPPFYLRATGPLWSALIALMGIAPLSAWGRSTVRTLGKAMWKPAIPTLLTPAILFILGMRNWIALIGFTLVSFVIFTILFEFWRTRVNNIFKKLGRTTWLLLIPTFIALVVYTILGIHNWLVLVWYTLVAYLGFVILTQIWRYWIQSASKTFWRSVWLLLIALIVLLENLIVPMIFAILGLQYFALVFYIQVPNFLVIIWILSRNNPRRYGGYLIHLSMVVMAIGILGIDVFQTQTQQTLAIGQQMQISGYTLRYDSLAQFPYVDGRQVTRAVLSVFKDGKLLGELHPRYDLYPDGQPMTIPAIRSTMADDLYVVLVNWENVSAEQTPFKVYHNPLVNWLWVGSFIFIFGILVAGWPIRNQVWSKK